MGLPVGMSHTHWIDKSQMDYPSTINIDVPSNCTITGAHINVKRELEVINDEHTPGQLTFINEDKHVEVAVTYELTDGPSFGSRSLSLQYSRMDPVQDLYLG